jgi:hypothetical protein
VDRHTDQVVKNLALRRSNLLANPLTETLSKIENAFSWVSPLNISQRVDQTENYNDF